MKSMQRKLLKRRLCIISRTIACASFLVLAVIGVSSLARAMSLETIANENGVPTSWQAASLSEPDSITLPITYWDQKADSCDDPNRQFEWTECTRYRTHGVLMGMVKSRLGADRLPVPAFSDKDSSWNALHDALSENVIGHDPVQPTDNFYRWFHEVPGLSRRINGRTVTFNRTAKGTYVYGGQDIYPIDDISGLDASDTKLLDWRGEIHNFHFTAHLSFAIKVNASGNERFEFSGDDDVWVYLNDRLILDMGGLHGPISGWFQINTDGTVTTSIEKVNDLSIRTGHWVECMRVLGGIYADDPTCIGPYNTKIRENFQTITTENLDFGLKPDDVVSLDFFYAERSTDGSNTKITINHMNWPISADSEITAKVVGKIEGTENKLVEFNTFVKNRDPENPLNLERLAAYIVETTEEGTSEGYLPLDKTTLFYTTTPDDETSWQPVDISAPDNSTHGFNLATPIRMAPSGKPGDTLYFRYYGESSDKSGTMSSTISYYTTLSGNAGITYDYDEVSYTFDPEPENPGPETPEEPEAPDEPTPEEPETPETPEEPDPETPEIPEEPTPELPIIPIIPGTNIIDGELEYLAPLGEVAFVPNTGIVRDAISGLFGEDFAETILSQTFVMITLLIFAGSFAVYFSYRKFLNYSPATRTATSSSKSRMSTKPSQNSKSKTSKSTKSTKTSRSSVASKSTKMTSKSSNKTSKR